MSSSFAIESQAANPLQEGLEDVHEEPNPCFGHCCLASKCCACAFACLVFSYLGPLGLGAVYVVFTGSRAAPLELGESGYGVLGHRGQPKIHDESSETGYVELPPGIIWEMDLQRPSADGTIYIAHDPLGEGPFDGLLTLDRLLELAEEKNVTLIPEFKGTASDPMWKPEEITQASRRICRHAPWMQTFHPAVMMEAIAAGCDGVKILCLKGGRQDLVTGGLLPRCDGEGRAWGDVGWSVFRRWLQSEDRPLFVYTVDTRLHAQAVQALAAPFAIFSDDAAGLVGLTKAPPEHFGAGFAIGFVWFGLFLWLPLGLLLSPAITPGIAAYHTYCTNRWACAVVVFFIHSLVLYRGDMTPSADAFFVGYATSMKIVPEVWIVMQVASVVMQYKKEQLDEQLDSVSPA